MEHKEIKILTLKTVFVLFGIILFLISFVSAWTEDSFNNSLLSENITFSGNENITRWLSVPEYTTLFNGYLNLSGYKGGNCTQEVTNISIDGCGYVNSHDYIFTNGTAIWVNTSNVFDNDWDTYAVTTDLGTSYLSFSYKNFYSGGAIFNIKTGGGILNITLPEACLTNDTVDLYAIVLDHTNCNYDNIDLFCYNYTSASYNLILEGWDYKGCGYNKLYEESITWTDALFPKNASLLINNTEIWNHTGELNSTNSPQKTSNLASVINNYISTTTAISGYYLIPFIFHSDAAGILEYSSLIFNNSGYLGVETYNSEVLESSSETFTINVTYDSYNYGDTISSTFYYNGTGYTPTKIGSGNNITYLVEITTPEVAADINISFYWELLGFGNDQNSTSKNQTVQSISIDDCSVYSNSIFNITAKDEELLTILSNSTKEIAINLYSSDRSNSVFNLSGEYLNNPTEICLNHNLTSEVNYSLDVLIKYSSSGYADEYYNIVNLILSSDLVTQAISLYNLNSSDSTEFQLTFTGNDFLPVEDALIYVERKYISEDVFKTVELPKTDSNGQTILHLVRNDVIYNIIVIKDSEVLGRFTNLIAFCDDYTIGSCKVPLNALDQDTNVFDYDEELGILFENGPLYNDTTKDVSFSFSSVDGTMKTVSISAERSDVFGNTSICTNTLTSVSGTVSCNVGNISDSTLIISISVDGEILIISPVVLDDDGFGTMGYVGGFVLTLILILILGNTKEGLLVALLIGYIIAVASSMLIGGIIGVGTAGIWLIVLTVLGLYLTNRNK